MNYINNFGIISLNFAYMYIVMCDCHLSIIYMNISKWLATDTSNTES